MTFDRNKLAMITPLAGGVLESVHVDVGDRVKKGDLMARVNSPAIAEAKSALVRALTQEELHRRTFAREKDLVEREIPHDRISNRPEPRTTQAGARRNRPARNCRTSASVKPKWRKSRGPGRPRQ